MQWWIRVVVLVAIGSGAALRASAADNDGLSDELERKLGTHTDAPDRLRVILTDGVESEKARAAEGYDATKDVVQVEMCHAGGNRYLWRVTLADTPRLADTVLHLYIDADSDRSTGRKVNGGAPNQGVEYMLTVASGSAYSTVFLPDGERAKPVLVTHAVEGRTVLLSADVELGRDEKGCRYELYVLCHTASSRQGGRPPMSDSTRRVAVTGVPLVARDKVKRMVDITEAEGTQGSYGLDIVRATLRRDDVVVVPFDRLELDGFEVHLMGHRRYGYVKRLRPEGCVWTRAPRGRFHVGFMMYDDSRDERVVFRVAGKVRGAAFADCNNNRHWIYWLKDAIEFAGGEKAELIATGPYGTHGICNILFLPTPPPLKPLPYVVERMTSFTPVGRDGTTLLSWTTKMPSSARFEYGLTTDYGSTVASEHKMLVHRARLSGLDPAKSYHGRGVGVRPDGTLYYGPDIEFRAKAVTPPRMRARTSSLPLRVRNPHDLAARRWPVTSGIPFPQGALATAAHVRLMGGRGEGETPAQIHVTGRWLDGSVKWILVTFLANVQARAEATYMLQWGRFVRRRTEGKPIARRGDDGIVLDVGVCKFRIGADGLLRLPSGKPCVTALRPTRGGPCRADDAPPQMDIEENGSVRAVVKVTSRLRSHDRKSAVLVEQRVEAYRGQPLVRVHHTFTIESPGEFLDVEEMTFSIPLPAREWRVATVSGEAMALIPGARVVQRFDNECVLMGGPSERVTQARIRGSAVAAGASGALVAVRDFWQQYPKAFAAGEGEIVVGLCPDFEEGLYDKFPFEKEGHQLYYYLLNGRYRLKRGMAKTHELLISLAPEPQRAAHAALFQRPLLATAPPEWYCASKAFYDVAPRDEVRFKAYEEAIDRNLRRYAARRERQRDYGMMNYGDWYGERGSNWGNIEYDTQHAFLLEYIRSGNEDAFFLADQTEKHNRDVDTVHLGPDDSSTGAVYIHQIGHVGGYYKKSVPGTLGFPKAGYTVSHAWAEGHFNHYFLTGDRRSFETGTAVADYFIQKALRRPYDFTSCRTPGWHLMINAIAYASTCDPYYLNASRVLVDRVRETQDVEPRPLPDHQREPGRTYQVGGWSRMMHPGHCHCIPRDRGNAGFMVAVLLSGLKYFHDVTGDPAVKEVIIRGAHYLMDECYSAEVHGFRYTSCPKMRYRRGTSPLMAEGIARAYLWTRDVRFKDVLTDALPLGARGGSYGKGFSMYYRVAPRVLADLAACGLGLAELKKPPLIPFKRPGWMSGKAAQGLIIVQAETFTGQGGGKCQIRDDRQGMWGKIVTYWHQDIGHWLEWKSDVPRAGRYFVRFHYATGGADARRELRIDGRVPCPQAADIAFEKTGGYGGHLDDWRFRKLTDAAGREIPLKLAAGKHTVRMTNLKDGLALDFFVLVPVR